MGLIGVLRPSRSQKSTHFDRPLIIFLTMRCKIAYSWSFEARERTSYSPAKMGDGHMFRNVLDAIRDGDWMFEPEEVDPALYPSTSAVPGTEEKLAVLAARAEAGLPLWHHADRPDYEEPHNRRLDASR
jgi:hypothetical protein